MSYKIVEKSIGEITTYLNRGITPEYTKEDGLLIINQRCIRDQQINLKKARLHDAQQKKVHKEKIVNNYDVLINSTGVGTLGRVAQVDQDIVATVDSHVTIARPNTEILDPKYFGFLMRSIEHKIEHLASGSTGQTELRRSTLEDLKVKFIADKEVQKEIGIYLDKIDQKIEINQQMNESIDELAAAIFKSWFVDFDPVYAKIQAKKDGYNPTKAAMASIMGISLKDGWEGSNSTLEQKLSKISNLQNDRLRDIASSFPEEIEGSDQGNIPAGWSYGNLGEICNTQGGYAFKSDLFNDEGGNPVVKIKNIKEDFTVDLKGCQYLTNENSKDKERYELKDGDYLIAMTGATVGKTGILASNYNKVFLNQRVAKFESDKFQKNINWFIHAAFLETNLRDQVENIARGSAQPNISCSGIESTELVIPDHKLVERFLELLDPLFKRYVGNFKENEDLKGLRDTLLPKLISGKVEV